MDTMMDVMVAIPDNAEESKNRFSARNREAVQKYLKTVLIADNAPILPLSNGQGESYPKTAVSGKRVVPGRKSGGASNPEVAVEAATGSDGERSDTHVLDLQAVTDAFAAKGTVCGVYLPAKGTADGHIAETLQKLAGPADASIFDWELGYSGEKCAPTIEAINKIIEEGLGERLRLIVVYTGDPGLDGIAEKLRSSLISSHFRDAEIKQEDGYPFLEKGCLRIVFCNKENSLTRYQNPVPVARLPDFVIDQFSKLSQGLLRSYALACIASIRDDAPRLMTQFGPELDGVFIAQRASIPDPDDALAMMHDIMLSDLGAAIRTPEVEKYLGAQAGLDWFEQSEIVQQNELKDKLDVIREAIKSGVPINKASNRKIKGIWTDLCGKDSSKLVKMSHLVTYSGHAHTSINRKSHEKPALALGSVIRQRETGRYVLCIVPRCDGVRLTSDAYNVKRVKREDGGQESTVEGVRFPFIELCQVELGGFEEGERFLYLLPDDEKPHVALSIKYKKLAREIVGIGFMVSSDKEVVLSEQTQEGKWVFQDVDGQDWEWIGCLREMVAQNIVAEVCNALNRVGLNEYEWLRQRRPFS